MPVGGVFCRAARVIELHHRGIVTELGSLTLLLSPSERHLLIGEIGIGTGPRAARAVRAGDAGKPLASAVVARCDAIERHEFQVVLMRTNAQMRYACKRTRLRKSIGDEYVRT